jgi:hypothetical protein
MIFVLITPRAKWPKPFFWEGPNLVLMAQIYRFNYLYIIINKIFNRMNS